MVVGVVYSALKIAELLIAGDTRVLELLDGIALALGATLIGGGFLYPLAASSLSDVQRQLRARRLLIRLRPAWRNAIARRPGVVLGRPPRLADDLVGRDATFRLYRRLIEVQDAALESGEAIGPAVDYLLTSAASVSRVHVAGTAGE